MAEHTPIVKPRPSGISRRTIVKGAAWAVPATAVVGAAPAFAASPSPSPGAVLEGFVEYSKIYDPSAQTCDLQIDGRGAYPDRGLWVRNQPTPPTSAVATIYLENPNWVTTNLAEGTGWSDLTIVPNTDPEVPASFTAYQTTYNGGWTTVTDEDGQRWEAATDPAFIGVAGDDEDASCEFFITTYVRRTITVGGEEFTIIRTQTF